MNVIYCYVPSIPVTVHRHCSLSDWKGIRLQTFVRKLHLGPVRTVGTMTPDLYYLYGDLLLLLLLASPAGILIHHVGWFIHLLTSGQRLHWLAGSWVAGRRGSTLQVPVGGLCPVSGVIILVHYYISMSNPD